MKRSRSIALLALAAVAAAGCEDVTNPVEEFGQLADPYVRFVSDAEVGTPVSETLVVFVMPTRVEEDVEIAFAFGGDAVFGQDYWAVDRNGNTRSDVTASGGTAIIAYDPDEEALLADTLRLFVPANAVDGRHVEIEIVGAFALSGRNIETGYIDRFRRFSLSIEGFVDIPVGDYAGERTGDLGTSVADVTITKPPSPIQVGGRSFQFVLSDYTGDGQVFGVPVPWSLSVTSGGTVVAAEASHAFTNVTSDVEGTFDFETNTLTLDIELSCCGGEGLVWQLVVTL